MVKNLISLESIYANLEQFLSNACNFKWFLPDRVSFRLIAGNILFLNGVRPIGVPDPSKTFHPNVSVYKIENKIHK